MAENNHRPLLIFPTPVKGSRKKKKPVITETIRHPTPQQQWERLSPKFAQLKQSFINIQSSANGIDPEYVLVVEMINNTKVKDFADLVCRIDGLEWLGEIEIDDISPDECFYDTRIQLSSARLGRIE